MSSNSSYAMILWRIGFGVIIGALLAIVLYCIRSTCIDIRSCPDDVVITPSPKCSSGSKLENQSKGKEHEVQSINADRRKIQHV